MKLTDDKKFFIPEEDECGWRWGAGYELNPFLTTMKQVDNRGLALDIGAHVGIWSKRLASEFKKVLSFEPIPKHIECWKQNVKEDNVTMIPSAVSNVKGKRLIKYTNYFTGLSTFHYNVRRMEIEYNGLLSKNPNNVLDSVEQNPKDVLVDTCLIDDYNLEKVDFIKMDVEGHELQALAGAEKTLKEYKPVIYIEITRSNVKQYLIALGYKEVEDFGYNHYLYR